MSSDTPTWGLTEDDNGEALSPELQRNATLAVLAIAAVITLLHLLTNVRYGPHRDELQFLSDALHLDFGYVAYPPFTPLVERALLAIFGLSLVGLRLASVLAQALLIVTAGATARALGGGRLAQTAAALAVALSPISLFEGTEFQYSSFDLLWWALIAYGVVRLLTDGNPRWWLWVGIFCGLALETKYSVVFYIGALFAGFLLAPQRRLLYSRWFLGGCALGLLIFLPNLIWQVHHGFISYHFLQHIHVRDVGEGRGSAKDFWLSQILLCTSPFAVPLVIAGVVSTWRRPGLRPLSWMFLLSVAAFAVAKGRGYYTCGAYPAMVAAGSVAAGRWLRMRKVRVRWSIEITGFTGIVVYGAFMMAVLVPFAAGGRLRDFALARNGDLREEFGWNDLVQSIARVRDTLPPDQRAAAGVLTGNYGEQGAVELLGGPWGLPRPISLTNSAWLRGYPTPQPATLIVVGFSARQVEEDFTSCRLAGQVTHTESIKNEESADHTEIYLCGPPRLPWPVFWRKYQRWG